MSKPRPTDVDDVDAKKDEIAGKEDDPDARLGLSGLNLGGGGSAAAAAVPSVSAAGDDADNKYRYRMDHRRRGRFIIINNKTFLPGTGMNERKGTDVDAANLSNDFTQLGFDVTPYRNQTASEMLQLMAAVAKEDHRDCDCFAVAVLSHGDDGKLYGTDGIVDINNFIDPIKSCQSLAGKPKIFIFQACRGNELDAGTEVDDDDAIADKAEQRAPQRIPIEADFLYAYSTTPGYFSWRNSGNGSWFIQALHLMMEKFRDKPLDFLSLLTRVNYEVAYAFESNASQAYMSRKKQVPSIVSMLTKDLFLTPKKK